MPGSIWPKAWSPEVRERFEGFIASFIDSRFRSPWRHLLVEKPEKARQELVRFEHHHADRYCELIDSSQLQSILTNEAAALQGLFFDGHSLPRILMGAEVSDIVSPYPDDAIFSIAPGKRAIVISHENCAWNCVKRKKAGFQYVMLQHNAKGHTPLEASSVLC